MFPIRDHNPSTRTPFVVFALIGINVLVWLYDVSVIQPGGLLNRFYTEYAMVPAFISQGEGYQGFLTHMFLHGGFLHLAGNMLFLWIYGDNMEDEMGHLPFLGFYLACGLAAALGQYLVEPWSNVPMVGASGAIAGVMGAYLLMFPKARVDILIIFIVFFRIFPIPAWIVLGLWLILQIAGGFSTPLEGGGVAYFAHLGGFVAGAVLALPLFLRRGGPTFWSRTHGHPPHPEARYALSESRVPRAGRRR